MTNSTKTPYAGHRFPPELISYTVWLYFRFPLSLRMVEEMLAFRGIEVSHETIRQWGCGPKATPQTIAQAAEAAVPAPRVMITELIWSQSKAA